MVEPSSILKHGTGDVEQPVDDRAKGARVAMAARVSQTSIAGTAMRNDAALATSPRHRCSATQTAQSMIVSTLQRIW